MKTTHNHLSFLVPQHPVAKGYNSGEIWETVPKCAVYNSAQLNFRNPGGYYIAHTVWPICTHRGRVLMGRFLLCYDRVEVNGTKGQVSTKVGNNGKTEGRAC